jgi:hypothetical protein
MQGLDCSLHLPNQKTKIMILQVKSITHLRELISNGMNRYFIRLNFGVKSSKWIEMTGNDFYVFHEIDGSDEVLTEQELADENIGRAIENKALYAEYY